MGRKVDWALKPKKGPGRKARKQPAPTFLELGVKAKGPLLKTKARQPAKHTKNQITRERPTEDYKDEESTFQKSDSKLTKRGKSVRPAKFAKKEKEVLAHAPESDDEEFLNDEFDPDVILQDEQSDKDDEEEGSDDDGSNSGSDLDKDDDVEDEENDEGDEDELPIEKESKLLLEKAKKRK